MLVYRVFPYLANAKDGEPGYPLYEHTPQRGSRIDHPDYFVWYVSRHAEAACGEAFGNQSVWGNAMFEFPLIGARRALATLALPDSLRILDLDDPHQLVRRVAAHRGRPPQPGRHPGVGSPDLDRAGS